MALRWKQEKFCQKFIETGLATEAYRFAYSAEKMKPGTIRVKANEVLNYPKVAARIKELMAQHTERHKITVDDLLAELEEARKLALDTKKAGPAVSATMGKARLLGLDRQILEHIGKDGGAIQFGDVEAAGKIAGIIAAAKERAGNDAD